MATELGHRVFDPADLSADERRRLEATIAEIEEIAAGRQARTDRAALWVFERRFASEKALSARPFAAYRHSAGADAQGRVGRQIIRDLPARAFKRHLDRVSEELTQATRAEDSEARARIQEFREHWSLNAQERILARLMFEPMMEIHNTQRAEDSLDRDRLHRLYRQVARICGGPMRLAEDVRAMDRFAREVGTAPEERQAMRARWRAADAPQRLEMIEEKLMKAFPEDDVPALAVTSVDLRGGIAGAYIDTADALVVGDMILRSNSASMAMTLVAHEYQHRRQARHVAQYARGELTPGTAAHIQGRLMHAQFEGGYLFPAAPGDPLRMLQRLGPYRDQPAELDAHAADHQFARATGPAVAVIKRLDAGLQRTLSSAAYWSRKLPYVTGPDWRGGGIPKPGNGYHHSPDLGAESEAPAPEAGPPAPDMPRLGKGGMGPPAPEAESKAEAESESEPESKSKPKAGRSAGPGPQGGMP